MARGLFVALEGFEGSGKSTQARLMHERMLREGHEAILVREPGGTPLAEDVRNLVLHADHDVPPNAEALLYQVARADLVAKVVRPALDAGKVVIADRFEMSTRCYQVEGRGLDGQDVGRAIHLATGGLVPDLYVVLDIEVAQGRERQAAQGKGPDRIERGDAAFHDRVARAFRNQAGPNIVHLEAGAPRERLHEDIWRTLSARFPRTFSAKSG